MELPTIALSTESAGSLSLSGRAFDSAQRKISRSEISCQGSQSIEAPGRSERGFQTFGSRVAGSDASRVTAAAFCVQDTSGIPWDLLVLDLAKSASPPLNRPALQAQLPVGSHAIRMLIQGAPGVPTGPPVHALTARRARRIPGKNALRNVIVAIQSDHLNQELLSGRNEPAGKPQSVRHLRSSCGRGVCADPGRPWIPHEHTYR